MLGHTQKQSRRAKRESFARSPVVMQVEHLRAKISFMQRRRTNVHFVDVCACSLL